MKHFLTLLIAVLSLLPSAMKAAGNKVITSGSPDKPGG